MLMIWRPQLGSVMRVTTGKGVGAFLVGESCLVTTHTHKCKAEPIGCLHLSVNVL